MVKRVLCIDGGGVRGLVPLYYLKYLEEDIMKLHGKKISEVFDIYGGTSIGSMIVSAIAYNNYDISEIISKFFEDKNIKDIFSETNYTGSVGLSPLYKNNHKTRIIQDVHGSKKLSDVVPNKYAMFTVYCIDEQKPKFFKSYKSSDKGTYSDKGIYLTINAENDTDMLLADVINASSSAPSYFSSVPYKEHDTIHYGIDGAVFANNPTDYIYTQALQINPKERDIRVLSLGTGESSMAPLGSETESWGYIKWARYIFSIMYNTSQELTDEITTEITKALGHKYIRVQKNLNVALDDVTKLDYLKKIAHEWYLDTKDDVMKVLF